MQEIITLEPGKIIIILFYRLEHFFREAYALTFGLKPGEKRKFEEVTSDVIMVMRTTLSKKEFASALGMKEGDYFIFLSARICRHPHKPRNFVLSSSPSIVVFSLIYYVLQFQL